MLGSRLGRLFLSVVLGCAGAVLLGPACVSIAHAQTFEPPPAGDLFRDVFMLVFAACVVSLAVEAIRLIVPAWKRTADMSDTSKGALRLVSILLGLGSGMLGWAPAIGDGSAPRVFGGVGAGLLAAVFGGLLLGIIRRRLVRLYAAEKAS